MGCQTYGPWAGSGPLDGLIRPGLVENKSLAHSCEELWFFKEIPAMLNSAARGANKKPGTDIGLTRDQEIPHIFSNVARYACLTTIKLLSSKLSRVTPLLPKCLCQKTSKAGCLLSS